MDNATLIEAARAAFEEAVTLATEGPRRVPHPDAPHEAGYLLPSAVQATMREATAALRQIARNRHGIVRDQV